MKSDEMKKYIVSIITLILGDEKMKKTFLLLPLLLLVMLCGCSKEHTSGDWVYTINDGNACLVQYKNRTSDITIPDIIDGHPVTELGERLFSNEQSSATSISIPDTVKVIGIRTFENCKGITKITIPSSVEKIDEYAFNGCSSLSNIQFEGNIYDISDKAFNGTAWLNNKPDGVIYIGTLAYALKGSSNECYIKSGTTHIKFGGMDCRTIHIPATVKEILPYAFANTRVENIYFSEGTEPLIIGDYAFSGCGNIKYLNFPERLSKIGNYAFSSTPFSGVTIPNSVTDLGEGAFSNCRNLTYAVIGNGIKKVPDKLLYGCQSLENITILDGVEYVGMRAFSNCPKVLNVTLPNSIKRMSTNAFWAKKWNEPETIHIIAQKGTYGEVFAHNHGFVFVEEGQ